MRFRAGETQAIGFISIGGDWNFAPSEVRMESHLPGSQTATITYELRDQPSNDAPLAGGTGKPGLPAMILSAQNVVVHAVRSSGQGQGDILLFITGDLYQAPRSALPAGR